MPRAVAILVLLSLTASAAPASEPAAYSRIIATAPNNAEIVCALGAEDLLVGVSPYASYPASLHRLPKIGGIQDPDLEQILALRPDLLLVRGRFPQVETLCQARNITLYHDETDTLPGLFRSITDIGKLLGRDAKAEELVQTIHNELEIVRAATAGQPRPRVLLTLRSPDRLGDITTVGGRSYLHRIIEIAGGQNIFADLDAAYPQVGIEEIIARDPDVIIEAMPGEELTGAQRRALAEQWSAVGTVSAVQNHRIHCLTEDYALIPSPRVTLLARKLHGLFAPEDHSPPTTTPAPVVETAPREP